MRSFYLVSFILVSFIAFAQEMVVPSSFNENKMIVKKMDKDGNFVPVDENTLTEPVAENKSDMPKPKRIKRFKTVETGYDFPKTTFGAGNDTMQLPSTFNVDTMANEMQNVRRDHTTFQECDSNDKDCQEYEVDENGQVVFK